MDDKPFEFYFARNKGLTIDFEDRRIHLSYRIKGRDGGLLRIKNFRTNSKWKQGVVLSGINCEFVINGQRLKKAVLWEDTFPDTSDLTLAGSNPVLLVYNVWDTGNGTMQYGHNGAGMEVEDERNIYSFNCNDGYPDYDMGNLLFEIEQIT